jgi:hypothetical protein
MSIRKGDKSPEIAFIAKLTREMYREEGIVFAADKDVRPFAGRRISR